MLVLDEDGGVHAGEVGMKGSEPLGKVVLATSWPTGAWQCRTLRHCAL
jgi:hypothetical protein